MNILSNRAELYERILSHINEGVFVVDKEMRITCFNTAAEKITGFSKAEAIGQFCFEIFRSSSCPASCALKETLETGAPVMERELVILDRDNQEVPLSVSTSPLLDDEGALLGGVETFRDQSLVRSLRHELNGRYTLYDIITQNSRMLETITLLPDMAMSDLPVLIVGESGTGKELFAQAIHDLSRRREERMVRVNCAAIPDDLMESELFGFKKGSFTGADRDKPGKFHMAQGGTLLLDEIGDLSLRMQAKLLRVLEDRMVEPVGATEPEFIDFRLVAAANRSLAKLMEEGSFREDLFYRLSSIRIALPPLRERREDIPLLVDHFLEKLNLQLEKSILGISPDAYRALLDYDYPGNVRQLRTILEHAMVLCRGKNISFRYLPAELREYSTSPRSGKNLKELEKESISKALKQVDGNISRASRMLGIHRTTLWRKMKKLGIT